LLVHGDLLDNLNSADHITEGVDDFDVLDVRDSVPGVAEMFYVLLNTFIWLLPDGI
jgi:hypothetical protein